MVMPRFIFFVQNIQFQGVRIADLCFLGYSLLGILVEKFS